MCDSMVCMYAARVALSMPYEIFGGQDLYSAGERLDGWRYEWLGGQTVRRRRWMGEAGDVWRIGFAFSRGGGGFEGARADFGGGGREGRGRRGLMRMWKRRRRRMRSMMMMVMGKQQRRDGRGQI